MFLSAPISCPWFYVMVRLAGGGWTTCWSNLPAKSKSILRESLCFRREKGGCWPNSELRRLGKQNHKPTGLSTLSARVPRPELFVCSPISKRQEKCGGSANLPRAQFLMVLEERRRG